MISIESLKLTISFAANNRANLRPTLHGGVRLGWLAVDWSELGLSWSKPNWSARSGPARSNGWTIRHDGSGWYAIVVARWIRHGVDGSQSDAIDGSVRPWCSYAVDVIADGTIITRCWS